MRRKNDVTLAEALQAMLQEYRLQPRLYELRIRSLWLEIMGPTIGAYTQQVRVNNHVLYLTVLSAPLKNELVFAKAKIVERINEALGEQYLRDVVIR